MVAPGGEPAQRLGGVRVAPSLVEQIRAEVPDDPVLGVVRPDDVGVVDSVAKRPEVLVGGGAGLVPRLAEPLATFADLPGFLGLIVPRAALIRGLRGTLDCLVSLRPFLVVSIALSIIVDESIAHAEVGEHHRRFLGILQQEHV